MTHRFALPDLISAQRLCRCRWRSPAKLGVSKDGTSNPDTPRASNAVRFLYSLAHNAKPIIAAVDGIAIGIGTTMLFHCDYVLASKTATFSTPFIHLGLVPEGASSLLMPRTMGHQRAFATLVMGRTVNADDAREAGFVNTIVAPGSPCALQISASLR